MCEYAMRKGVNWSQPGACVDSNLLWCIVYIEKNRVTLANKFRLIVLDELRTNEPTDSTQSLVYSQSDDMWK